MNTIRKNFLYNVVYQILLIVLPLITTPYISRVLGVDGVGTYSYTYTVARYFVLFAMLGVANYGNRTVAAIRDDRERLSRVFWQIYGLQFLCAMLATTAYFAFVLIFDEAYFLISLLQGFYVLSSLLDISWLFFGLEQFRVTVSRNIAIRLLGLACVFLFVRAESDLWKYTLIMALSTLLSQGYLWFYLRRFVTWKKPTAHEMFRHFQSVLILFIPVIAVSLYKMMDKVMLEQMSSITQVGYYESTEKILNIPIGVITALGTVMLPRMSHLAAKGQQEESKKYIYYSIIFAVFLASAMQFGIAGIAPDLVPLFLGEDYQPCILLLEAMAPTVCFVAWANVIRTQYLIPNHMDRSYIISVAAGAVVNICVNIMLIPRLASMGATIGTILAEATVCIYQAWAVRKNLKIGHYLKDSVPLLLLGFGMFLLVRGIAELCRSHAVALVLEILIGGIAYVIATVLYLLAIRYAPVTEIFQKIKKKCYLRRK